MIIARSHPFYNTIDINPESYNDLRRRLEDKDLLDKYKMKDDEGREIIVFGSTGLRAEQLDK